MSLWIQLGIVVLVVIVLVAVITIRKITSAMRGVAYSLPHPGPRPVHQMPPKGDDVSSDNLDDGRLEEGWYRRD